MRRWKSIPYPSFIAGFAAVLCVLLAAVGARRFWMVFTTMDELTPGEAAPFPTPVFLLVVLYVATGVGLWFERDWARTAFRIWATASLLLSAVAMVGFAVVARVPTLWHRLIIDGCLCYMAWTLRFYGQWRALPSMRGLRQTIPGIRGRLTLCYHQLRRLFGFSYLPWSCDPVLVGRGGQIDADDLEEFVEYPSPHDLPWTNAGAVVVTSGRLLICDPTLLPRPPEDLGVRIDGVPPGRHRMECQIVRLRAPYGLRVVRIRVRFEEAADARASFRWVTIDSAQVCVGDPDRIKGAWARSAPPFAGPPSIDIPPGRFWSGVPTRGGCESLFTVFPSGLGDGVYSVVVEEHEHRCVAVGIELTRVPRHIALLRRRGWRTPTS